MLVAVLFGFFEMDVGWYVVEWYVLHVVVWECDLLGGAWMTRDALHEYYLLQLDYWRMLVAFVVCCVVSVYVAVI